jgi:hypothetical protein
MFKHVKLTKDKVDTMLDGNGKVSGYLYDDSENYFSHINVFVIDFNENINLHTNIDGVMWDTNIGNIRTRCFPVQIEVCSFNDAFMLDKNRMIVTIYTKDVVNQFEKLSQEDYEKVIIKVGRRGFKRIIEKGICSLEKYKKIYPNNLIANEYINDKKSGLYLGDRICVSEIK